MEKELLNHLMRLWTSREELASAKFEQLFKQEFFKLSADDQMAFLDRWAEETNRMFEKEKPAHQPLATAA